MENHQYPLVNNYIEKDRIVRNVPCRHENDEVIYSAKTMNHVIKMIRYMRKHDINVMDFGTNEEK